MSEGYPGSLRLVFQGARSRRSACNEGSLWRYQSLINANSFALTASAVGAGLPLTVPEWLSEERVLGAYFAHLPLTTARARAASGPTAFMVRPQQK